jgi:hypothetical protein
MTDVITHTGDNLFPGRLLKDSLSLWEREKKL